MGLKKNNPGCGCCETCLQCSAAFRPILGYNLTLSGVAEGSWYELTDACAINSTAWTTTNMAANLNTSVYIPVTSYFSSETGTCFISAISNVLNVYTVTQSSGFGSPRNVQVDIGMGYSRAGVGSDVSYSYSIAIQLDNPLSGFVCSGTGTMASSSFAGTASVSSGDTCKTWITTRTLSLTQEPLRSCLRFGRCYHTNAGYDGFASVTAVIEPVWTS